MNVGAAFWTGSPYVAEHRDVRERRAVIGAEAPPTSEYKAYRQRPMKTYMCLICSYVYDEEEGDVESGIPAGTRWEDVPLSWRCPDCGAGKEDFEMVEI